MRRSRGRPRAAAKRSDLPLQPQFEQEPDKTGEDALAFLADYARRGALRSCRSNAHLNTRSEYDSRRLPTTSHTRSNENHENELGEPVLESGTLGSQNKLTKLKRKLDTITQPLHSKTALQTATQIRPVTMTSNDDAVGGCGGLQKQKSGIDDGGKRPCMEGGHVKGSDVPPMDYEHVTSSSSIDSSLQHVPSDIHPSTALQNPPASSPSSPQSQPICSIPQPAILSMHPPAIHQPRDIQCDSNLSQPPSAPSNKIFIRPDGSGFYPNHTEVIHCITRIFQSSFDGPWPTWKKVPMDVRDQWFEEFQKSYYWHHGESRQIRLNFEMRGMARLKDTFCLARKNLSVRPLWLRLEVWDALKEYWGSPEFKSISDQAKINRGSDRDGLGSSLHTCGSIPMSEHKRRLEEKTGEEVTPVELFVHTHQRKDKSWIDARSSQAYEKFTEEWNKLQNGQSLTDLDSQGEGQTSIEPALPGAQLTESEVWLKTNLTKKGTIYGLGSEAVKYKCSNPTTSNSKEDTPLCFETPEFQDYLNQKLMDITAEWNARFEEQRREREELRKRVTELEREKQEKVLKMKKKKKLKKMKKMMKLLQMSYASLSKNEPGDESDEDDDDSSDSD